MKLPTVSGKEIMNLLLKQAFVVKRQRGSHMTLYKKNSEGKGLYVTVPIHGNTELVPKTLLSILNQAELSREEFIRLFQR